MATSTEFRGATADIVIAMKTETCAACGVLFAITAAFEKKRREDGQRFFCPNGHHLTYGDSEKDRLKKELDEANRRLNRAATEVAEELRYARLLVADLDTAKRQHAATKGVLTKTRKRIENGVCPDCNRHFANVERHMASQHKVKA